MTTPYAIPAPVKVRSADVDGDAESPIAVHRIDAAHQVGVDVAEKFEFDPVAIRIAHTEHLIEFLQHWSEELDERAAKLHADIATQERRERAFRMWMQNRRVELDSQIAEYQQARRQTEAVARRLAVGG